MAFAASMVVAHEWMVMELIGKRLAVCEYFNDFFQFSYVKPTFFASL